MAEGATLAALDETGLSQTPTVVRTWARTGKTPVIRHPFSWKKLSALVILTILGDAFRDIIPGAFCAGRVLVNLKALLESVEGRIVLLLDNASIHKARAIREWLQLPEVAGRLEIVWLPPYAPEFNPVELVFSAVKRRHLGNYNAEDLPSLEKRFREGLHDVGSRSAAAIFKSVLGIGEDQRQEAA